MRRYKGLWPRVREQQAAPGPKENTVPSFLLPPYGQMALLAAASREKGEKALMKNS